jgi:outer membrane receptor protein involved in Fe transport
MTLRNAIQWTLLIAAASAVPQVGVAQSGAGRGGDTLEEVIVFGRAEKKIGVADAASEGTVGGDDLLVRPLLRVAELLEAVPGLIAAQHSGSGKANQYFLRGFQLDHGTDFTTYVDDMPWNLRTHGHGQGYLDVNGLIPEIVERIDYRKGPYRADAGDFSMAGSGYLTTIDRFDESFTAVEAGSHGWGRIAMGGSMELAGGDWSAIAEYKTYDSPFDLDEDLKHKAVWTKYARDTSFGRWEASVAGYMATWRPTEQTPESAFGTPGCPDEYCSLDRTAYGKTDRWILTSNWWGEAWRATAYAQFYDWHMLSNATYEPDGQIDQFDRRWTFGGRYERNLFTSDRVELKAGAETRFDAIDRVGLDSTVEGEFVENIANNNIDEGSVALYAEATWRPIDALRVMAGFRGDYYDFDVAANVGSGDVENVGAKSDKSYSPKFGVAYAVSDSIELYGNWGQGFHSNDARGVVKRDDPVPGLVLGTGYEAGVRYESERFNVSLTNWWLNLSSELIFVGDDNTVEPKGSSERRGWELVAFWRPIEWLGIDAVYTRSRARYDQEQEGGGFHVEGGVESAGELGVSASPGNWELSARLRYLGPYALLPDNSERSKRETMLNVRAAYNWERLTVYGEVLNVLDHDGKDIVYFYENFYDPDGGRVSRAEEPRSVRAGLKYRF